MPFDTLKAARTLEAAGVEPKQAEAMVDTVSAALCDELATKSDLTALGAELRGDIRLLKWMFGALVVLNTGILLRLFTP